MRGYVWSFQSPQGGSESSPSVYPPQGRKAHTHWPGSSRSHRSRSKSVSYCPTISSEKPTNNGELYNTLKLPTSATVIELGSLAEQTYLQRRTGMWQQCRSQAVGEPSVLSGAGEADAGMSSHRSTKRDQVVLKTTECIQCNKSLDPLAVSVLTKGAVRSRSTPAASLHCKLLLASLLLLVSSFAPAECGNPDAKRLYDDLLSNYNKLVRPVVNVTDVLTVMIKLKLSQLIDVVSTVSIC